MGGFEGYVSCYSNKEGIRENGGSIIEKIKVDIE